MTAYEEFLTTPQFAAAFTAAYRGRHEAGDALWWLEHPSTEGPSGAHSPTAELAPIRNAAYARGADAAAHEALERLEAQATADREATLDALAVARTPPEPEAVREVEDVASPGHPWRLLALIAVGALVAGAFAGRQLSLATAEPEVVLIGTPAASTSPPAVADPIAGMTRTLERVAEPSDELVPLPPMIAPGTSRVLSETNGGFVIYAARHAGGSSVCLVVVVARTGGQSIECLPETAVPETGLSLHVIDGDYVFSARWLPSGSVEASMANSAS